MGKRREAQILIALPTIWQAIPIYEKHKYQNEKEKTTSAKLYVLDSLPHTTTFAKPRDNSSVTTGTHSKTFKTF